MYTYIYYKMERSSLHLLWPSRQKQSVKCYLSCVPYLYTYTYKSLPSSQRISSFPVLRTYAGSLVSLCSIKPPLKKVSKYDNKFAKLQKKAAEFNFRNQLKQVKKKEFTIEEEDKVRERELCCILLGFSKQYHKTIICERASHIVYIENTAANIVN